MMVAVENTRSLTYYACWTVDERQAEAATAVPMAKAYASDMAKNVTSEAIQVHGGYGFSGEFEVERYYRDARILGLYEGTNEIQKLVIAERILGPAATK